MKKFNSISIDFAFLFSDGFVLIFIHLCIILEILLCYAKILFIDLDAMRDLSFFSL